MAVEYHLPSKWDDLNDWQMSMVSKILHSPYNQNKRDVLLVYVFVLRTLSFRNVCRLCWFLWNVSLVDIIPALEFIHKQSTRTKFPKKLKNKDVVLFGPKIRLSNVSIEQFGYAVTFFNKYNKTQDPVDLYRLVSCLYSPYNIPFSRYNLDHISEEVKKVDFNQLYPVFLAFAGSLDVLANRFPALFPKKTNTSNSPSTYNYDKMMMDVSLVTNPFGKLKSVRKANVHDFFNYLNNQKKK